jgi:hypothetical protein
LFECEAVERQTGVGSHRQCTVGHCRRHIGDRLVLRRARNRIHENELVANVAGHQVAHNQGELAATIAGVDGHGAVRRQHRDVESGVRGRRQLDEDVDPIRDEIADLVGRVAAEVVDDWSAPAAWPSFAFSSLLMVVITRAPPQRASWMAAWPTAPAPPATSTV